MRLARPESIRQSRRVTTTDDGLVSTVPTWPELIVPVLTVLSSGETIHRKNLSDSAAEVAGLSPLARAETLTSGGFRYEQRIGWALSNLAKAGWVDRPSRGHYVITDGGRNCLRTYPQGLTTP
jgi:restriction system protein